MDFQNEDYNDYDDKNCSKNSEQIIHLPLPFDISQYILMEVWLSSSLVS